LKGTIIHFGTAEAGHYYSYIQERTNDLNTEGNWYEFNDSKISEYNKKDLPEDTFGGEMK